MSSPERQPTRLARGVLVAEAVWFLLAVRIALGVVPFRWVTRRLGTFVPSDQAPAAATDERQAVVARRVRRAIARAVRFLPFRLVCLPQALAAAMMLSRRDVVSVVFLGAATDPDRMFRMHAWLTAAGVPVTGYPIDRRFTSVTCLIANGAVRR